MWDFSECVIVIVIVIVGWRGCDTCKFVIQMESQSRPTLEALPDLAWDKLYDHLLEAGSIGVIRVGLVAIQCSRSCSSARESVSFAARLAKTHARRNLGEVPFSSSCCAALPEASQARGRSLRPG